MLINLYFSGNVAGLPIYEQGKPCTNCPSGSSCDKNSYTGLCKIESSDESEILESDLNDNSTNVNFTNPIIYTPGDTEERVTFIQPEPVEKPKLEPKLKPKLEVNNSTLDESYFHSIITIANLFTKNEIFHHTFNAAHCETVLSVGIFTDLREGLDICVDFSESSIIIPDDDVRNKGRCVATKIFIDEIGKIILGVCITL